MFNIDNKAKEILSYADDQNCTRVMKSWYVQGKIDGEVRLSQSHTILTSPVTMRVKISV